MAKGSDQYFYVIKADEIVAVNSLTANHTRPIGMAWINRATDQKLNKASVDQLFRTLDASIASKSVVRLHETSGLRLDFRTMEDRTKFVAEFSEAKRISGEIRPHLITGLFSERAVVNQVIADLDEAEIPGSAISVLWRASQFIDADMSWFQGHSPASVAAATTGGGVAGALLGVSLLVIPGIGQVAAAGMIASSAFASVAALSGIIGATGGALAKMLTDHDVDGVSAMRYQREIRRGRIFVSVDSRSATGRIDAVRAIFKRHNCLIGRF